MKKLTITEKDLVSLLAEAIKRGLKETTQVGSMVYGHTKNISLIREGLIMSYEPKHVMSIINKTGWVPYIGDNSHLIHELKGIGKHTINNGSYKARKPYNTTRDINKMVLLKIVVEGKLNKDGLQYLKNIEQRFNTCGYYFSGVVSRKDSKFYGPKEIDSVWTNLSEENGYYEFLFEPKYNVNVHVDDIPDYCYHICETRKLEKILSQGLKPASGNRVASHPERVHLFLWKPENWKSIAKAFSESRASNSYTLLMVDTGKMRNKIKFFFDQNTFQYYPDAIYTFEPIPADCLYIVDQYNINKD